MPARRAPRTRTPVGKNLWHPPALTDRVHAPGPGQEGRSLPQERTAWAMGECNSPLHGRGGRVLRGSLRLLADADDGDRVRNRVRIRVWFRRRGESPFDGLRAGNSPSWSGSGVGANDNSPFWSGSGVGANHIRPSGRDRDEIQRFGVFADTPAARRASATSRTSQGQ